MSQKNRDKRNYYGATAMTDITPTDTPPTDGEPVDVISDDVSVTAEAEAIAQPQEELLPIEVNNITNPIPPDPIGEPMATTQEFPAQSVPSFIIELNAYVAAMQPNSGIDHASGGMEQYKLWMTVKSILLIDDGQDAFNNRWNMLLAFVYQYRDTVFHEGLLFRFPDAWYGTTTEFNAYRRVFWLIISTCDGATRAEKLRYINLDIALSEGLTEEEKNKINSYYH